MGTGRGIVHVMGSDDLVLDSEVVEREDVLGGAALERVQILHLEVVLVPLELQARPIRHQPLQVRLVQQVVHSFFVNLQIGAVDCELFPARATLLLDHLKEKANRARHNTLVLASFHHSNRLSLIVGTILVAFHGVGLSRARLAVGENRRVVPLPCNAKQSAIRHKIEHRES